MVQVGLGYLVGLVCHLEVDHGTLGGLGVVLGLGLVGRVFDLDLEVDLCSLGGLGVVLYSRVACCPVDQVFPTLVVLLVALLMALLVLLILVVLSIPILLDQAYCSMHSMDSSSRVSLL